MTAMQVQRRDDSQARAGHTEAIRCPSLRGPSMRHLLITAALLFAGSAQAGELATCDALQKRY